MFHIVYCEFGFNIYFIFVACFGVNVKYEPCSCRFQETDVTEKYVQFYTVVSILNEHRLEQDANFGSLPY